MLAPLRALDPAHRRRAAAGRPQRAVEAVRQGLEPAHHAAQLLQDLPAPLGLLGLLQPVGDRLDRLAQARGTRSATRRARSRGPRPRSDRRRSRRPGEAGPPATLASRSWSRRKRASVARRASASAGSSRSCSRSRLARLEQIAPSHRAPGPASAPAPGRSARTGRAAGAPRGWRPGRPGGSAATSSR